MFPTAPDPSFRHGNEAIRLAEMVTSLTGDGVADVLDALAVAAGRMELASQIESHLRSYRARRPWRDGPA